jgi:hypothetical protein
MRIKSSYPLVAVAIVTAVGLCALWMNAKAQDSKTLPARDLDDYLDTLWKKVTPVPAANAPRKERREWLMKQTTWLPGEWPPTPRTVWTRYVYGLDVTLDGSSGVSAPIARIERSAGNESTVIVIPMEHRLKEVATHPVRPHGGWKYTLADERSIFSQLLTIKSPPSDIQRLAAYYHSWRMGNAEIAEQVMSRHRAFFNWLKKQPTD